MLHQLKKQNTGTLGVYTGYKRKIKMNSNLAFQAQCYNQGVEENITGTASAM